MTLNQLVDKLAEMRTVGRQQSRRDVTVMMHLFGIIFAAEIAEHGAARVVAEFTKRTGERIGGGEQIRDGCKLAGYVVVRPEKSAAWIQQNKPCPAVGDRVRIVWPAARQGLTGVIASIERGVLCVRVDGDRWRDAPPPWCR